VSSTHDVVCRDSHTDSSITTVSSWTPSSHRYRYLKLRPVLRRYNHISDALATLHWLKIPERVDFNKVAVMAFRVLCGLAPSYLDQLVRVADLPMTPRFVSITMLQVPV